MKMIKWIKGHLPTKRRMIQLYAALLFNANLKGFGKGRIYQGNAKYFCTPGLNCYSCPGASGSCPLGATQNALASCNARLPYYVFGILLLYGLIFARWICGFLCPFGLIQELLHKIKTPKLKKNRFTRALSYLKYVILVLFVVIFPLMYLLKDMPLPGFCKYICPAGTLGGAIGLLSHSDNADMFGMLGPLFTWKFLLLVLFVVGAVFIYRFFCRFFCPLGAIYGLFNKISFIGVDLNRSKCTDCGLCVGHCKMDIRHVADQECISCGECMKVCPTGAITWKGGKVFLDPVMEVGKSSAARTERARLRKRAKLARTVLAISMAALLGGALYYYNVVNKIPEVSATPDTEENTNIDGVVIPSGNTVGTLCYTMDRPLVGGDGSINAREYRGKVTIINFWGTWCGPCKAELPDFDRIATDYADDVKIIAYHSDYAKNTALNYVQENFPDSNMIFATDEGDAYYTMLGGEGSYPMTWVLDENGVIVAQYVGMVHYDTLKGHIEAELYSHDCKHENHSQATCTTSSICLDCGRSLSKALGHANGEWIIDKDPTCTEDGSKHQVCSVCSSTIKTETLTALGHTNGEWIIDKDPTCTEDGSKHQVCSVCNSTIKTEISIARHINGEWIIDKDPTCTEDGSKHQVCSVCSSTIKTETLTALGHSYASTIIKATAENNASISFNCDVCGYSYAENVSPITVVAKLTGTGVTVSGSVYYSRNFEVTATGGYGTYKYRFESGSNLLQDYSTENTTTVYGNSFIDYATIKITVMDEAGQKTVYEIKGDGTYVRSYVVYE